MLEKIGRIPRKIRTWISRSEWVIRFLGLSKSVGTEGEPGLLMIQIDGLSRKQLESALKKGKMPFLNRLIRREGYHLHTLYSGLPSSTPAIQGELFYGVKGAVPAFSFLDRTSGKVVRMFDSESVTQAQKSLAEKNSGLLENGSSYANIYSGGSREIHFCPESFGWDHLKGDFKPLTVVSFILIHAFSLIRTGVLVLWECVLAVMDFVHGLIAGKDLFKELKFVPTRVAISILLRDLITIGATVDVIRGLPVVHLNFLGYDEQAHRRGPSSLFAHWTLKGIDDAIRRLVHSARRSSRREYDIWVYSDHGQEETIPYPKENGKTVQQAVEEILSPNDTMAPGLPRNKRGVQFDRSKWLGGSFFDWLVGDGNSNENNSTNTVVTALGPIGHLYLSSTPETDKRNLLAEKLVKMANIPLVLAPGPAKTAEAWTQEGKFTLPQDAAHILGKSHPFLKEAALDLAALCHHPNSGDLVISGWRLGKPPISFPFENGAHAGPGSEETRAFALLPVTAPVSYRDGKDYLRPLDLREGALHILGRNTSRKRPRIRRSRKTRVSIRVMTYNVHSCINMDGKISPARIAKVIAHYDPDIVALQELDVKRFRTGEIDQAQVIAEELEMECHFSPAFQIEEEQYGNAILSRFPLRLVRAGALPTLTHLPNLEKRGVLWAEITVNGREIQLFNTHLGLRHKERLVQGDALMGPEWLGHPDRCNPTIVCGDFNAQPHSRVCRKIRRSFNDAQILLDDHRPQRTFFGRYPIGRIDHVFVSPEIIVHGVEVPRTALTLVASDHLPLIVEVSVPMD
jgi:endonuclease/exonuclease/phosphatase family metal-dependent hydrolase